MLQLLDEARLGVAVRRTRLLVQHAGAVGAELGAAPQRGNTAILVRLFLRVFRVVRIGFLGGILGRQSAPAWFDEGSAHRFEDEWLRAVLGCKRQCVHAVFGIRKLGSDSAGPDKVVELLLVLVCPSIALFQVGGADCFVGLLGALFGLPGTRLGRQGQVVAGRVGPNLGQRLGGEVLAVGAVVGNQPLFKEPLGNLGGLLRLVSERHACRLKQRGRCEGRRWGLGRRLGRRGGHGKESAFRGFFRQRGVENVFLVLLEKGGCVPLGAPFPVVEDRFGAEVLCLFECLDLALPINDEAESNTLNASGTEPRNACLVRESRRNLIADEPVSAAPRLLCMNKVGIELSRRSDCGADYFFSDCIESYALVSTKVEKLLQVPCNSFSLAVGVRSEINLFGASGALSELRNNGFAPFEYLVFKPIRVRLNPQALHWEIPNMPDACCDIPTAA